LDGSHLHLRVFDDVETPAGVEAVAGFFGLRADQDDAIGRVLGAALIHDSYLYENPEPAPRITRGTLRALDALGIAWLNRDVAVRLYHSQRFETVGQLAQLHAAALKMFSEWVQAQDWPVSAACYGKGEFTMGPSKQARRRITCQVIGCLAVFRLDKDIRAGLASYYSRFDGIHVPEHDPMTELAMLVPEHQQSWLVSREGPDHVPVFTATLSTPGKRPITATGGSRRSARQAVARKFLDHYGRVPSGKKSVRGRARPFVMPKPMSLPPVTDRAVTRFAKDFKLDATWRPLLTQSFIHSSWVHEHRRDVEAACQQDNQILVFVGSHVLHVEYVRSVSVAALNDPTDDLVLLTQTDELHAAISRALRLDDALLLGGTEIGQRGTKRSISANVFQALSAALYLGLGTPPSLVDFLPTTWAEITPLLLPIQPREEVPKARLEQVATASGLLLSYKVERKGPDHDTRFCAIAELNSPVLRCRIAVRGAPAQSKSAAKQNAAETIVDVLTALGERLIDHPPPSVRGSVFLLSYLIAAAQSNPALGRTWQKRKLLGAELRDPHRLLRWAKAADDLIGQGDLMAVDPAALAKFYRTAAISAQWPAAERRGTELATVTESIAALEDPSVLTGDLENKLVQLCAVYRAAGMQHDDSTLADTIDGWTILYPKLVHIDGVPTDMAITSGERDTLDYIVSVIADCGIKVSVSIDANRLQITPTTDAAEFEALCNMVELFSGVSPRLVLSTENSWISAQILGLEGDTPIVKAVINALKPQPDPLDSAIADTLHDLKNLVSAARQEAVISPDCSRTDRLSAELTASYHLDQAKVLARQLGSTKSTLTSSDATTEISAFLRRYSGELLKRLPVSFPVVPATLRTGAVVAVDQAGLTAILNNLVKNTQEAVPDGAVIRLDCVLGEGVAEVEVSDDGPGVPASVVEALRAGRSVQSSKINGNGLGLASVQKLVRRVGGTLTYAGDESGAVWRITLPLAEQP